MLLANTVYSKENTCVGQWCLWSAGQEEWQAAQDPGQGKKASGGKAGLEEIARHQVILTELRIWPGLAS